MINTASYRKTTAKEHHPKHFNEKSQLWKTQAKGTLTKGSQSEYFESRRRLKTVRGTWRYRSTRSNKQLLSFCSHWPSWCVSLGKTSCSKGTFQNMSGQPWASLSKLSIHCHYTLSTALLYSSCTLPSSRCLLWARPICKAFVYLLFGEEPGNAILANIFLIF